MSLQGQQPLASMTFKTGRTGSSNVGAARHERTFKMVA
eukprot:CAMPEP_0171163114 /NCGR_PEP_ID=MMETSP0790-20130122/4960_1 /TAXON_ID=2925 /ORGANISM="Alexandrium catenella, Strain OF101" /LENGTH=37 /DNA_ID= /DNA_START= /DNA_END= /DNA_ORIENTATION=